MMVLFVRYLPLLLLLLLPLLEAGCKRSGDPKALKLTGTIETTTVTLSFKAPGRLVARLVDEGQAVTQGQLIARLEDDELRDEQRMRAADEQASIAVLADLKAGSRREEIAAAEASLARLKAEADRATRDAERAEALFKKEVIPRKELDAARAVKDASQAAAREGDERLQLVRIGPRPDAIRHAQSRVAGAAAARSLATTRLSQAVLASPLAGFVLSKHAEPGELLAAGAPVVTVARLDEVWVRGYIPETALGKVKLGQQVRISSDTWPGRSYTGTVSFISPEAEFTPKNVQTETERVKLVYRIKVTIPNPKQELKPGMPVDAVIETAG